jgi:RNA polymerase sigma-70 factor (ECF subfamily)
MDRERENALLQGIKKGNIDLFEQFILEYQQPLFIFIHNIVRNAENSRDLCQETFFKAYRSLRSFKGKSKFSTWLFQIGYFLALNFLKKRKKWKEISREMLETTAQAKPGQVLETQELNKMVEKIMPKIHFKHRTALFLFYKEEKSYGEIASIMKTPLNTIKSYIFRGKEEIRKKMMEDFQIEIPIK